MLRVTVWEESATGKRRLVGEVHIHRASSSTEELGDYDFYFSQLFKPLLAARPWRHVRLEGYQRWRYSSHWHLIAFGFMRLIQLVNGHGERR